MWTISPEAFDFLEKSGVKTISVDMPVIINGCCLQISEPPLVHLGELKVRKGLETAPGSYTVIEVQGIRINVPSHLSNMNLVVDLTRFFRREKLVIEGWNLC
ncbi:hypothetical protein Desaci_4517 [Desulfosporosinus acidiphilus SJ4]|uniref:Uncharacterized protein n=1 Tax=Desulfosporosinus acidiphilus (strain DSM 22704 / JCM 16185 / SJ4) TaxID=646529 RepID=I4DC34_DESAJ|nr:hypothetical protein [Desulfosporosinus acidiphilus]AFM43358.1 hypothetical protein Desaci_4517 [Desulfosporosinus acidiphilus SJ4]